ncbi:MAG: hypothetical protein GY811_23425 [Myxococcales bacterium]|nr:hypothetical protein [Myxococcales bacterium]
MIEGKDKGIEAAEVRAVLWAIHGVFPTRFPLPRGASDADAKSKAAIIELWRSLLHDLPAGSAILATRSALSMASHPPTPGEIRRAALGGVLHGPTGAEAWGEVSKAIGRWGRDRADRAGVPPWSSPAIAPTIAAVGGWRALCGSENQVADRARFVDAFDRQMDIARRSVLTGHAKTLDGAIAARIDRLAEPRERIGTSTALGELIGKGKS